MCAWKKRFRIDLPCSLKVTELDDDDVVHHHHHNDRYLHHNKKENSVLNNDAGPTWKMFNLSKITAMAS